LRTAIHLLLTYLRRRIAKRALRCSAPAVWNSLPKNVLSSDSVAAFLVQAKDIPLLPGLLFFLCSLTRCLAPARVTSWRYTNVFTIPPQICELSIVMSVSVCLCVWVCLSAITFSELHVRSSNILCMLPMAVARSFSGGVAIRYVLPVYG